MHSLVCFDLDGVLVDAKDIHFDALNAALAPHGYHISRSEHLARYDGLPTREKLAMVGVPKALRAQIAAEKQELTEQALGQIPEDPDMTALIKGLQRDGFQVAVVSNATRRTCSRVMATLGIHPDVLVSNQDVDHPKPSPEGYLRAMIEAGVGPSETLIVEDSRIGRQAAERSGAQLLAVNCRADVTDTLIRSALRGEVKAPKYQYRDLNVLIPMAGAGSRFAEAGYTFPKPLIDVNGRPMIQVVVENLNLDAHHIFVVDPQQRERYALDHLLNLVAPGCDVIETPGLTEGAACTALLARDLIDTDRPLLIANSDQYLDWESAAFLYSMVGDPDIAGGFPTFTATHPKWSFAELDTEGFVTRVAEKQPISDMATCGLYYWKHGHDFVQAADAMVAADDRHNGEYYICPVYNHAIAAGLKFRAFHLPDGSMHGLGTPEDLRTFLAA